jgi:acyl-[acyl-carrier-protein]-phospholipid O-acyltransferase/long-chain-fatty-acid--[acyl-carrier-protein] ligase
MKASSGSLGNPVRFRVNEPVVPGPVLLLPNHVSWLDWLFLLVCLDEDWRFVTSRISAEVSWLHRRIMINHRTFPIDTASPYAVKRMAEYLKGGGRLVLFPEGRLSRTGTLMKLFDGTGFLLFKTQAKVITCYLRGARRLPLSPHSGWKKWFPEVTCHFSEVLTPPKLKHVSTTQARLQLTNWLRDRLALQQFDVEMEFGPQNLVGAVVESAQIVPTSGRSYRRLLVGADLLGAGGGGVQSAWYFANVNATPLCWAYGPSAKFRRWFLDRPRC